MRIRFFNTYEPVSPFYRDLIPYLAERGYEIEILVSSVEYRAGRTPLERTLDFDNVRIRRIPTGISKLDAGWKKVWVVLTYMIGSAVSTLFGRSTDLNFFMTQPPFFQIWGRVLRLLRWQPYHCLVMDLYPDVAINNGAIRKGSLVAGLLTWLSRNALRNANRVVVIGRCMQDVLEQEGVEPNRIRMIPNWANENEVRRLPIKDNKLRKELAMDDKFICLYSGNIGVSHMFEDILHVARELELEGENEIQFVFIGDGSRRSQIESFREQEKLSNISMLQYQPTERLSESLGLGDVHFVCLRSDFVGKVVPSKAYGAMAAGKPIIYQGDDSGEIARMILEANSGHVVPDGDAEMLKQAILICFNDRQLLQKQSDNAYRLSRETYSREAALARYLAVFQDAT